MFVEGRGHVVKGTWCSGMVHGAAILNNLTIKFIVPLEHAYLRGALVVKEGRGGVSR